MTGAELKRARLKLGLSAADLQRVVGCRSVRAVHYWEAGERTIPGSVAILVSLCLRLPEVRRHLGCQIMPRQVEGNPRR
jgi:transcriptional regulator with XRE-family HTH domain